MMRAAAAMLLIVLLGCGRSPDDAAAASGALLYVWAGDADSVQPDFLAVVDADRASATYGRVLTTVPVTGRANVPHHIEYELSSPRSLFANGWGSGTTFAFDLRDPMQPRVTSSFTERAGYRYPHSYARLPSGNVLATYQTSGDGYTATGGLVELDSAGNVVRSVSGAAPGIPANETWTYSLLVLPDLDRAVTTNTRMGLVSEWESAMRAASDSTHHHVSGDVQSTHVQIWRLSDLSLKATLRLPAQQGGHNGYPAEARRLANGNVYVNTFSCGLYRIIGVDSDRPSVEPALASPFEGSGYCAVPVVAGNYWIHPSGTERAIITYDLSDPARPREASRLVLDSVYQGPHWLAIDSAGSRLVLTFEANPFVLILNLDHSTGALSIDERFRDPGAARPGISFDRTDWPHGAAGRAMPHGVVFGRALRRP